MAIVGGDQNSQATNEEIQRCKEKIDRNKDFILINIICEQKEIALQMEFILGHQNKAPLMDAVKSYQPTIVILDRYTKHKKFFMDNLKCCICRVRHHNTIGILRGPPKLTYEEMLGPEISCNLNTFKSQHEFFSFCCSVRKDDEMDVETSVLTTNYGEALSSATYECLESKCTRSLKFGREPKVFDHSEIEAATEKFSSENFLFEGGFGLVYRGRLEGGQYIAVKKQKGERDKESRFEVELLSYAQHINLVNLLGYCDEVDQQLLVYEYVCNGSLDEHLHKCAKPLPWNYRQKIAEGTAKGLRYLHEEYREGCIVHRDVRPKNILLTHDFEPKIFGLATSQKTCEVDTQTRVVGTFGYLAPEYTESGKVSTKTDVYSFGMVLLELITGRSPLDRTCPGQNLIAWARPLLKYKRYHDLVDPLIMDSHDVYELYCMVRAANLCLRKDPDSRPSMSQVLQILEGNMMNQLHEDFVAMNCTQTHAEMNPFALHDDMIPV
ncbi:hypothetical protein SUGI_1099630 [Cryptomeria japonica]|nr:hypothetical protein SUGI_1099630 [Cryptomeria japonica]